MNNYGNINTTSEWEESFFSGSLSLFRTFKKFESKFFELREYLYQILSHVLTEMPDTKTYSFYDQEVINEKIQDIELLIENSLVLKNSQQVLNSLLKGSKNLVFESMFNYIRTQISRTPDLEV